MNKNKNGVISLLRQILAEQKKQTKMLKAIESSQEHLCKLCSVIDEKKLVAIIHDPKNIIDS